MHKKLEDLTEIKHKLTEYIKTEVDREGICCDPAAVSIMGEFVDMIKDLAEAEEKCWKACYYKEIVCAMDEERSEEGGDRMGYDTRRYSSGRYAPKGRGHYSPVHGYTPMPHMMEEPDYDGRMGYPTTKNQSGSRTSYSSGSSNDGRSGYGRAYDDYREARRGYHDTHSPEDKRRMDDHAKTHLSEAMTTVREIWDNADQPLRQKMKADMSKLVGDMNV